MDHFIHQIEKVIGDIQNDYYKYLTQNEIINIDKEKIFNIVDNSLNYYKENKNMPSETSLDEKLSDLVGASSLKLNKNFNLDYNFAIDENYKELNYNEIGATVNLNLFVR